MLAWFSLFRTNAKLCIGCVSVVYQEEGVWGVVLSKLTLGYLVLASSSQRRDTLLGRGTVYAKNCPPFRFLLPKTVEGANALPSLQKSLYEAIEPVSYFYRALRRRHLNSGQRAGLALDIEEYLAKEAKERQREAGITYGENHPKQVEEVPQILAEPLKKEDNEAREQAAKLTGTNRQYVSDAERIAEKVLIGCFDARYLQNQAGVEPHST